MQSLEATVARYPPLIVFACAVGMAFGAPIFLIYGFGVFIDPLTTELGVGRGPISLTVGFGILANIVGGPVIGAFCDRFGARRVTLVSVVAMAGALASFSLVQNLSQLYAVAVLTVLLGAATGPITFSRIIAGWFNERRGLALGFALIGIGLGGAAIPVVAQTLIEAHGWRAAYQYLGMLVLLVSAPTLYLLLRERPPEPDADPGSDGERGEPGSGVAEALRQPAFWIIGIGFLLISTGNTGGLVHMVPMLTDAGLTAERASWYAGALGIGVIGGRITGGFLIDIFHAPWVAVCFLAGPLAAFAFFLIGFDRAWAIVPVVLFGIGMGAEFDVIPFLVSRYFGLRNFGTLYGIQISMFSIGSAIGPALFGFGYDRSGTYNEALIAAMVILLTGAALISRLGPYRFK